MIYIENSSKTKVLGTAGDGKVLLEDLEEDKAEQLWKKGERNSEGFFTLENFKLAKVLTAISPYNLEIKGNIFLSCIPTFNNLFVTSKNRNHQFTNSRI